MSFDNSRYFFMDKLKPGDLVQVWDWYREKSDNSDVLRLASHGDLGYIVKRLTETEKHTSGNERRMANKFLEDFRTLMLGRVCLEVPNEN